LTREFEVNKVMGESFLSRARRAGARAYARVRGVATWKSFGGREFGLLASTALLLLAGAPLLSQQQGPTISVNVKMVTMFATVRDKHGALIRKLTKDDFALQQDGHPQTITYFAPDSDLPLTLGLLVDTSMSQRRVLDQERDASHAFIDHLLREGKDKAFVIHFDHEVELLQDLTSSRQKLEASLDLLGRPQFSQAGSGGSSGSDPGNGGSGGGGGRGSHGGYGGGGGTLLYDAVFLASDVLMMKQQGRKAIVVLTDGVDRGSKETLRDAIETAQRADTLVYSILFADKEGYGNSGGYGGGHMGGMGGGGIGGGGHRHYPQESRPDGKKVLQQLSKETGGRFFEVTKKETIDQIYAEIDEELHNQYALGYTPDKVDADVGYHKIELAVKQKDAVVQTREGFYIGR
jgi:VWFA-related protein